jgi:competence protein ComFC
MNFFYRAWKEILDFIFPPTETFQKLEKLSSSKLVALLPPAKDVDDGIISLFDYQDSLVRDIVWELKYNGNRDMARKLAEILYDTLINELSEQAIFEKFKEPFLIPMPISDKRRNERGYNQIEILCEEIVKLDTEKILKYKRGQLVKHRHTESQTRTKDKRERMENIKDSMHVQNETIFNGSFVVLVDDVYTTGSTYKEARRALRSAGAKKILFVSIAH